MARKLFLNYIWEKCIQPQVSYSFSIPHDIGYAIEAVQEANLATQYNPLFWECACLCINAGNTETGFDNEDEVNEDETSDEEKKTKSGVPSYGKISKALSDARLHGVIIEYPDINSAQADFIPDIKNNSILYSLKTVTNVSDDLFEQIIQNRPYTSIEDFCSKVNITPIQMSSLIKAGSFNSLYNMPRPAILLKYYNYLADKEVKLKDSLTLTHLKKALKLGETFPGFEEQIRLLRFKQYIDLKQIVDPKKDFNCVFSKKCYRLNEEPCIKFFKEKVERFLSIGKGDYDYVSANEIIIKITAFDTFFKNQLEPLNNYLNSTQGKEEFRKLEQKHFINELISKNAQGTEEDWDMQTMSFYSKDHALKRVATEVYNIQNFNELPELPVMKTYEKNGETKSTVSNTCTICGTVVSSDNIKHVVSLLTNYGVVVNVKLFSQSYNEFSRKISVLANPQDKKSKIVLDDSLFKRGTKLLIHGFRRENMFVAKADYSNKMPKIVGLIEGMDERGILQLRYKRVKQ